MTTAPTLSFADIGHILRAGFSDFRRAPAFGLFFSAFYVLTGLVLTMLSAGTFTWTILLSLGFPLVAPFAAVGLYEISRRIEASEPINWSSILSVVWEQRGAQTPWIGAILVIIFLFWSFFAHMSLALFLGNMSLTNISTSWEVFLTPTGLSMIGFQILTGGLVAVLTFAMTVISLPMLLDRDVDFVTAMLTSLKVFKTHWLILLIWAACIAGLLFLALLPMFLGLLIVLPVLGHATWHLYTRLRPQI